MIYCFIDGAAFKHITWFIFSLQYQSSMNPCLWHPTAAFHYSRVTVKLPLWACWSSLKWNCSGTYRRQCDEEELSWGQTIHHCLSAGLTHKKSQLRAKREGVKDSNETVGKGPWVPQKEWRESWSKKWSQASCSWIVDRNIHCPMFPLILSNLHLKTSPVHQVILGKI